MASVCDKIILGNRRISPWAYLEIEILVLCSPMVVIVATTDLWKSVADSGGLFAIASGVAIAAFSAFYYKAVKTSNIVVVVVIIQTAPIISLFWGWALLGEMYAVRKLFGMGFVLLAGVFASLTEYNQMRERQIETFELLSARYAWSASFCLSVSLLLEKLALIKQNVTGVFVWQRVGFLLLGILIIIYRGWQKWPSISDSVKVSVVHFIAMLGWFVLALALSHENLATTAFLGSLQPIYVMSIGIAIGRTGFGKGFGDIRSNMKSVSAVIFILLIGLILVYYK